MAEIVISVVAKVAEYLVSPITRQVSYLWNYTTNFDNLKKEAEKLEYRRDTVQHSVDAARRNGEEIEQHISVWLDRARTMIDEANEAIRENEQANMKCFKGLCPNPKKHHQHSRKAAKKAKAVAELCEGGNFPTVSYRTISKEIWIPSHKGYEAFESRISTLTDILNALNNPDMNVIGIHGTGGIGKTTLAREVAAHVEDKKFFDVVAFAEVTVEPKIKEIQQEIAEKMGLALHDESVSGRARKLQGRFKQEKKVLLVLDNIWEGLDLQKVGIPLGDDHKGCKILLTARSLDVLSKMESQSNFQINVLDKEEAWSLFKKKTGACVENNDHFQALAEKVVEACGGLPIAVNSVAVALKGKGESVWKNALQELTTPSPRNFEGVAAETYSSIEISFNQLRGEELKSTFLLCSIMGNTLIQDLLAYGMGLGMFKSIQTIEQARNRVISLSQQLKDSSLLLDADDKKFSLHDVIRDVARSIASRDWHMLNVTSDVVPRELIGTNVLQNCIKISLHDIRQLPPELECPRLKFLYMRTTKVVLKVPNNFFSKMPELKVLHMVRLDLNSASNSLGCLKNLRTILMDYFKLDIHFIGEMKQLEILKIRSDVLRELPMEMCNLTGLRLLDLNDCYNLKSIPPNVLSALTQLEELFLCPKKSNIEWEVEGIKILDELKNLLLLTNLEINIPDANALPKGRFLTENLKRYKISIGPDSEDDFWSYCRGGIRWHERSKDVKLNLVSHSNDTFHKTSSVEKFLSTLNGKGFPELESLEVRESSWFRTIVDDLKLGSFLQLRTIRVFKCNKLKNIFSLSTNRVLPLLEEVEVFSCDNMEETFAMRREEDVNNNEGTDRIEFKQLRILYLSNLPKMTSFCRINSNPNPFFNEKVVFSKLEVLELTSINFEKIWHNQLSVESSCFQCLRQLKIERCSNLKVVFSSSTVTFPSLDDIQISNMDDLEMIWANQLCKDSFPNLKSMKVRYCKMLLTIFQSSILEVITRLESLTVENCVSIEKIFDLQELDCKELHPRIEGQLRKLYIFVLPKLEHIWNKDPQKIFSFPKLKNVDVGDCWSLKYLFPISIAKSLPELEQLHVIGCGVEKIVVDETEANEAATFVFPQITYLKLFKLPTLKTFYDGVHTSHWPNLKTLELRRCHQVELLALELFNVQKSNEGQYDISIQPLFMIEKLVPFSLCFQNLTYLEVVRCNSLKNLVMSSTAKSLVQLREMIIMGCNSMIEVVVNDKDVTEDNIIFSRLRSLQLFGLSSLICFCSGNYIFELPSLEELIVGDCPKMKYFSSGVVTAHILQTVRREGRDYKLEDDLNTTIQKTQDLSVSVTHYSEDDSSEWEY